MKKAIVTISLIVSPFSQAADCGTFSNELVKDCTTKPCVFEACWSEPQPSAVDCKLYIKRPTGTTTIKTGIFNDAKDKCTFPAFTLPAGRYLLNTNGFNACGFGGSLPSDIVLITPYLPPSDLRVQ